MTKYKVALFDVDGVLIQTPKLFSELYCETYNVDPTLQRDFYATKEFKAACVGKYDLGDAIRLHNDKWQWHGTAEELMSMWFDSEKTADIDLMSVVNDLRKKGVKCYLATQQEKYRMQYLKEEVFRNSFDGVLCTSDIGFAKDDKHFWQIVIDYLKATHADIETEQIVYFDDRQELVDIARALGVSAFLYVTNAQTKEVIGL